MCLSTTALDRSGHQVCGQTMDMIMTASALTEVNAAKELKVKESFLGKVRNAGSATAKRINKVVI